MDEMVESFAEKDAAGRRPLLRQPFAGYSPLAL